MDLSQTSIWDHAFSLPWHTKCVFQKKNTFLSKEKFNGESEIPIVDHLFNFIKKCISHNIYIKGAFIQVNCTHFHRSNQEMVQCFYNRVHSLMGTFHGVIYTCASKL